MPLDEEVAALEVTAAARRAAYTRATEWARLPQLQRVTLVMASSLMSASCAIVYLWPLECFVPFRVTDSIDVKLGGDWTAIMRPLGQVSLCLFAASIVLLQCFGRWARAQVARQQKAPTLQYGAPLAVATRGGNEGIAANGAAPASRPASPTTRQAHGKGNSKAAIAKRKSGTGTKCVV